MKRIDLVEFIPATVRCGKVGNLCSLYSKIDQDCIMLSYWVTAGNNSKREWSLTIPRYINSSIDMFEVLGLLQAEMGKTDNGCISFCNHEFRLVNKVMKWFDKELETDFDKWRWYIKLNINEPERGDYKEEIEKKVVNYWLNKTRINPIKKHPKTVSYIKDTKNKKLRYYDYGTLIIEYKCNLLSQIIKRYVKFMSFRAPNFEKEDIRGFMTGIIAGESNVELNKQSKGYRVGISAVKAEELELYQRCLSELGINSKKYQGNKIIISKRRNNIELLRQRLMCLSHEKYNKFLNMMKLYPRISEETGYFCGQKRPYNKISKEKIDEIARLSKQNPSLTCKAIAERVGVSPIKISRVRRELSV